MKRLNSTLSENEEQEIMYLHWLNHIAGLKTERLTAMLGLFGTAEGVYRANEDELKAFMSQSLLDKYMQNRQTVNVYEAYEKLMKNNIKADFFYNIGGEWVATANYPEKLIYIPDPPFALYHYGELPSDNIPSIAVIGARDCSEYGNYVAQELGDALGGVGIQVISGMARGVDGISQEACIDAGGKSFACLGSGVDVCYPMANKRIYEKLKSQGGIISSYVPGTPPNSINFPPRNRIVSGLSDAVVVIEARARSGTLITVDMGLEQGRDIFVVPGRITDRLSDGCNALIGQGAGIITSIDDFVSEVLNRYSGETKHGNGEPTACHNMQNIDLKEWQNAKAKLKSEPVHEATTDYERVFNCLDFQPRNVNEILYVLNGTSDASKESPLDINEVSKLLILLCLDGKASQIMPGFFVSKRQYK